MVDDLGQVLNPMIVNGQQHGGVAQGIGQARYEHPVYDRSTAQLVTGSFYGLRDAARRQAAEFRDRAGRSALQDHPIGAKGIGESGTIGAPPVVINAIIDALRLPICIATRRIASNILTAYLGPKTAPKVLTGQIQRGTGEEITAVLWVSDLRGFTERSDRLAGTQ